ncbi:hypothetical protein MFM001_04720 [Mycobacterium sp. MFM001]|uniref:hypothetical protein n=1 Tax=Mycobacterium sp. MFM001 TaxID=2049453 RepID=UPI000DA5D860|nr:hypothetical protein [Mycobacterium sp. MFM001]GBE64010.1 hypothetical protein MFM001_04720 [Mycobacterium sp. MFM001]
MPWYPGSDGRSVTNFWDGQHWLISLTNDHLMLDGQWIALSDITQVAYWNRTIIGVPGPANNYGSGMHTHRGFCVKDIRGNDCTLNFDNPVARDVPENEVAWRGLADISRRFIEPLVAQRVLASLRAGVEYTIDDGGCFITLSNSGFRGKVFRAKAYSWADFYHVEVNAAFNNMSPSKNHGQARVWAQTGEKRKTRLVTGLDTTVPNAVVLATLMPMCAQAFATRIV